MLLPNEALICLSRNYPTLQNMQKKQKLQEVRAESGGVLETAQFGWISNFCTSAIQYDVVGLMSNFCIVTCLISLLSCQLKWEWILKPYLIWVWPHSYFMGRRMRGRGRRRGRGRGWGDRGFQGHKPQGHNPPNSSCTERPPPLTQSSREGDPLGALVHSDPGEWPIWQGRLTVSNKNICLILT